MNPPDKQPETGLAAASLTDQLVQLVCEAAVPDIARQCATHALLDWTCVALAGMPEPAVQMLQQAYGSTGASRTRLPGFELQQGTWAALIAGTAGHALDYDDVNSRMHGHPSAPVVPAALAAAWHAKSSGAELLDAICIGHEVAARIGERFGGSHYRIGFHATGTIGTFGAAAAAARLMKLPPEQVRQALGLAAAQAAGLKSMFGTMTKPLHAGKAAMNGLMAAQLARLGFTAADDGIEGAQGFVATQCPGEPEPPVVTDRWAIQDTLYKFHAACYLTHASIEALKAIRQAQQLSADAVQHIELWVAPGHGQVCNIQAPTSGLEVKFSLRHLAAMVVEGRDTADMQAYTDDCANDAALQAVRDRVQVQFAKLESQKGSKVVVTDRHGRQHEHYVDVGVPCDDLDDQWRRLAEKGKSITASVMTEYEYQSMLMMIEKLEQHTSLQSFYEAITA